MKRIIRESEITKEDDHNWPPPDRVGRQELEIKLDNEHISFTVIIYVFMRHPLLSIYFQSHQKLARY